MSIWKLLVVAALAGGAYHVYTKKQARDAAAEAVADAGPAVSGNGFVLMPQVGGHSGRSVLVIAAENCPLEDAARADRLTADLQSNGVPVQRTHNVSFTFDAPDPAAMQRMQSVMSGQLPIVIVRGRGKANPSLGEVLAEYRGMK
jgi:hypothetical protein